jgi:hypothetical protein
MTTTHHPNETPLERELRFLDRHILRLEVLSGHYEALENELQSEDPPDEDRRREIYDRQTDLEIELVLLEACYDRKAKLETLT